MADTGHVLLADDEETFLCATADLLRREGYVCDVAADAHSAAAKISSGDYDLVISDVRMPGNLNLELIRSMPQIVRGLPMILVTGYPTLDSAVHSIGLPVIAYLTKPVDFEELLQHVRRGVRCRLAYKAILATRTRLQEWYKDLDSMQSMLETAPGTLADMTVDTYLALTLRQVSGFLLGLNQLGHNAAFAVPPQSASPAPDRMTVVREVAQLALQEVERLQQSAPKGQIEAIRTHLNKLAEQKA